MQRRDTKCPAKDSCCHFAGSKLSGKQVEATVCFEKMSSSARGAMAKLAAARSQQAATASAERRRLQFEVDNRKDKQPMVPEESPVIERRERQETPDTRAKVDSHLGFPVWKRSHPVCVWMGSMFLLLASIRFRIAVTACSCTVPWLKVVASVMLDTSLAVTRLQFSQVVCRKSYKCERSPSMMYQYDV